MVLSVFFGCDKTFGVVLRTNSKMNEIPCFGYFPNNLVFGYIKGLVEMKVQAQVSNEIE